jgi:hypothetical protein
MNILIDILVICATGYTAYKINRVNFEPIIKAHKDRLEAEKTTLVSKIKYYERYYNADDINAARERLFDYLVKNFEYKIKGQGQGKAKKEGLKTLLDEIAPVINILNPAVLKTSNITKAVDEEIENAVKRMKAGK